MSAGNKCGKCQNHEVEISKKGHARDCPFKKCDCLKCRLLDARSDILQVISGKETKLKGTKKDPNCGFCQNHGIKILRKGHVRSCGFGQERHFRLDNCFDCEVHYIRNEVNRLQIKMRRAMKEDRTLSEEQRKTAREAITRDEVEKVCDMARLARKKREAQLAAAQQVGESCSTSTSSATIATGESSSTSSGIFVARHRQVRRARNYSPMASTMASSRRAPPPPLAIKNEPHFTMSGGGGGDACSSSQGLQCGEPMISGVWRPWSAQQQQQQQQMLALAYTNSETTTSGNDNNNQELLPIDCHISDVDSRSSYGDGDDDDDGLQIQSPINNLHSTHQPTTNQLIINLGLQPPPQSALPSSSHAGSHGGVAASAQPLALHCAIQRQSAAPSLIVSDNVHRQPAPVALLPAAPVVIQRITQEQQQQQQQQLQQQQLFNTLFRILVAQFAPQ